MRGRVGDGRRGPGVVDAAAWTAAIRVAVRRVAVVALVAAAACAGEVTYHDDVRPILTQSCTACHHADAPGRVPLDTYAAAAAVGDHALAMMTIGAMPPFSVDRSGDCGTFRGPRPPRDDEIALFRAWVAGGMPEGALGRDDPLRREGAESHDGRTPDARVALVLPDFPAHIDAQRCFVVESATAAGRALIEVAVAAEQPASLHHVMVFSLPTETALEAARGREAGDPEAGFACAGIPTAESALVSVWTPGADASLPENTGAALETGALVVQVHASGGSAGVVEVALLLKDRVDDLLVPVPVALSGFLLPPNEPRVEIARDVVLGDVVEDQAGAGGDADTDAGGASAPDIVRVFGVHPHLHARGLTLRLEGEDGRCLVHVPSFRFDHQDLAFFEQPVPVAPGERLRLTCAWDTLDADVPIPWGERGDEEMCTVFLWVAR